MATVATASLLEMGERAMAVTVLAKIGPAARIMYGRVIGAAGLSGEEYGERAKSSACARGNARCGARSGAMRSDWPTRGAAVIRNSDAKLQQHRRSLSIRTVQNRDPLGGSLGDGIVPGCGKLCCDERHKETVDFKGGLWACFPSFGITRPFCFSCLWIL